VDVTLDEPLGGRPVRDGAREELEVEEAASPYESDRVP
jgi:hypothetical protein